MTLKTFCRQNSHVEKNIWQNNLFLINYLKQIVKEKHLTRRQNRWELFSKIMKLVSYVFLMLLGHGIILQIRGK